MKTYTLKAVLIFTGLMFVFPVFILLVASLVGAVEGRNMVIPYCLSSVLFLTYFYTKFSLNKFKLAESVVFAFIGAGTVAILIFKVCLVTIDILGLTPIAT